MTDNKETKVTKLNVKVKKAGNTAKNVIIAIGIMLVVASIAYSTAIIAIGGDDMGVQRFYYLAPQALFAIIVTGIVFIRGISK